jgi:hypothetical protein
MRLRIHNTATRNLKYRFLKNGNVLQPPLRNNQNKGCLTKTFKSGGLGGGGERPTFLWSPVAICEWSMNTTHEALVSFLLWYIRSLRQLKIHLITQQ